MRYIDIAFRNTNVLDKNRSCLFNSEIKQFKNEITKQKNSPICIEYSTMEVAQKGANAMSRDGFCLLKGQLDV